MISKDYFAEECCRQFKYYMENSFALSDEEKRQILYEFSKVEKLID